MKQFICLVICFFYYCYSTTLFAKEKIHWQTIHWPPWMILEGKNKGQGFADHLLQTAKQYQELIESGYSKPDEIKTLRKYYPCFINNSLEQQCTTLHE
ncbi:hypothetical protein H0A36_20540 [Endozoicomonas sp. SM1973]|uniref:Uncharacterized protein n=1 Tax=Spartinivicinus marinus TaxID=2994442 RepID=A0A853I6M9_9GAMM|nr:hypothetical protein [Spartinivicinus marinus]MCX4028210.1 hypothetical protein [Spartinivicinus marinus]NYZ68409.1 hypothetical protein [Spartinivicinus marinus]